MLLVDGVGERRRSRGASRVSGDKTGKLALGTVIFYGPWCLSWAEFKDQPQRAGFQRRSGYGFDPYWTGLLGGLGDVEFSLVEGVVYWA